MERKVEEGGAGTEGGGEGDVLEGWRGRWREEEKGRKGVKRVTCCRNGERWMGRRDQVLEGWRGRRRWRDGIRLKEVKGGNDEYNLESRCGPGPG